MAGVDVDDSNAMPEPRMFDLEAIPSRRPRGSRLPLAPVVLAAMVSVSPPVASAAGKAAATRAMMPGATAPVTAPSPLRIEVEPTIDDALLIQGWIRERNPGVAEKLPAAEGREQWIAVEIGGATYDYRVSVVAMRDGAPLGSVQEPEACECNNEKLLAMVDARIADAVQELRKSPPVVAPAVEPEPEPTEPAPTPAPVEPKRDVTRWRPGPMGYIGMGVGVLGLGSVAGGITLALKPNERRGDEGTLSSYSTRPPGLAMAVGGGVALVGGVTLVVVDAVRHRRRSVGVVPVLGPDGAGLLVTRRF